jgi:hypothetical protein
VHGPAPDTITVRTVPPLADWPAWTPLQPGATVPAEFQITADSLRFLTPAPGYRFRRADAGTVIHEPDPA